MPYKDDEKQKAAQKCYDRKRTGKRTRNWAFIIYPESAADDWLTKLREQLVPGFVSPLHDADVNPDGEAKKPHYHVLLTFKSVKTFEQVKEITDELAATRPEPVKDIRSYTRYLCHLDNPEKAQYQVSDVIQLGGTDYLEVTKSLADTDEALNEMMDWCVEQGCTSFFSLSNFARANRPDWFRVISTKRTVFLTAWLKSMEWELRGRENHERKVVWERVVKEGKEKQDE